MHLAGEQETSASWDQLLGPNVEGAFNVFDACRACSVDKIVFASSNHVIGGYDLAAQRGLDGSETVRPDSLYGVTKAFGEALGRYLSDRYAISIICLRIGWVLPVPRGPEALRMWLSPRDLCALVDASLPADVRFGIYYGTSRNSRGLWDLAPAMTDLGYAPLDDSESFLDPHASEPSLPG